MQEINDILKDLLKNVPIQDYVEVEIPSKCKPYKTDKILLKPMTYEDEKAIINATKVGANPVHTLLSNCIKGVEIDELLEIDRIYLIIKLRDISFGKEYSVRVPCEKCAYDKSFTFDISELPINFVPEDWEPITKVTLPVAKVDISVRLPRVKDEEYTTDPIKFSDNLWRFVDNVQGHKDKVLLKQFCDKITLPDRHTILNALNPKYGIDSMVKFECSKCKHVTITPLPIGSDFLGLR